MFISFALFHNQDLADLMNLKTFLQISLTKQGEVLFLESLYLVKFEGSMKSSLSMPQIL